VLTLLYLLWRKARWAAFNSLHISLAAGAVILPLFLSVIGKYPIYYSWIGWSCLCLLFFLMLHATDGWLSRHRFVVCTAVCVLSVCVGLGRYVYWDIVEAPLPQERVQLAAAIEKLSAGNEIFYADDAAYFEAWHRARHIYVSTYAQNHFLPGFPTIAPVTMMVVQTGDFDKVKKLVGGRWKCLWQSSVPLKYGAEPLEICRRL